MSILFEALRRHALDDPQRIALDDGARSVRYAELPHLIEAGAQTLADLGITTLGLLADNGIPWICGDLAALQAEIPCVPLPVFFSPQQLLHALRDCAMDGLLTDRPQAMLALCAQAGIAVQEIGALNGLTLFIMANCAQRTALPQHTAKITYTSGTTGDPKGVCLSRSHLGCVAAALLQASGAKQQHRHLCLTPLSTLLENIGGVYVPLLLGACCCAPALQRVGLSGATGLQAETMLQALHAFDASSAILVPQMLQAWVALLEGGAALPPHLHFVAVGGAPVSPHLLARAVQLGLPVYEGYGLSECASVVALNTRENNRCGTVGKPLPQVRVSFAEDGEILVDDAVFLGYLGHDAPVRPWPTGDFGFLDADGFLHVTGRKKSMFITAFGRNVAPEWVERELTLHPAIAQAAVFGEGKPWNCAVLVPRADARASCIAAAVAQINQLLPDYARIGKWLPALEAFTPDNGQRTPSGRLRRAEIHAAYAGKIAALYAEGTDVVLC